MIVLLDDNAAHRLLIRRAVKKLCPREDIRELVSLSDGMKFADALPEITLFIVDMNLGDGKGTEMIRRLRSLNASFPILLFSTSSLQEDKDAALEAGATHYIVKSEDPEEFLATVTDTLRSLLNLPR